jgi:hypothetical protein
MGRVGWWIAALATTNVVTGGLWAWDRGWVPGSPAPASGGGPRPFVAAGVPDAEKNARLRRLTDDLAIAQGALGRSEGEIASLKADLQRTREDSGTSRSDLDVTIATLRDLQRRLVPGEDSGNDLAKLVAWVTTALGRTVEERDEARTQAEAAGRRVQELDEALTSERATHQRHVTEAQTTQQAYETALANAQSALSTVQNDLAQAQARAQNLLRNNSIRMNVTGDSVFIEWALVFYKDSDADIRIREMSYTTDDEGWKVYSGGDFDFGEGLAVVFLCEKIGEPDRTLTYYATVYASSSGTFNLDYHW